MGELGREKLFEDGFNASLDRYRRLLSELATRLPNLPNDNFDTGQITGPGKYELDDKAQVKLLDRLARQNFSGVSPEIRTELLEYFRDPEAPNAVKKKRKDWARVQAEVETLRNAAPALASSDFSESQADSAQ